MALDVLVSRTACLTAQFKRWKIATVIAEYFHRDTVTARRGRVKVMNGGRVAFSVDPDDLTGFGKQVKRAADDVEESRDYVKKSCEMLASDVGPMSTVAQLWGGGHEDVVNRVQNTLKALQKILSTSSVELLNSAKHYEATDRDESRKMDAAYPASKR
ncbi:WXG100 family type VII secretion target [Streptomyces sp. NPDC002446]